MGFTLDLAAAVDLAVGFTILAAGFLAAAVDLAVVAMGEGSSPARQSVHSLSVQSVAVPALRRASTGSTCSACVGYGSLPLPLLAAVSRALIAARRELGDLVLDLVLTGASRARARGRERDGVGVGVARGADVS